MSSININPEYHSNYGYTFAKQPETEIQLERISSVEIYLENDYSRLEGSFGIIQTGNQTNNANFNSVNLIIEYKTHTPFISLNLSEGAIPGSSISNLHINLVDYKKHKVNHIVAIFDELENKVAWYLNGELNCEWSIKTYQLILPTKLNINNLIGYNTKIHKLRTFTYPLSAEEVKYYYNNGKPLNVKVPDYLKTEPFDFRSVPILNTTTYGGFEIHKSSLNNPTTFNSEIVDNKLHIQHSGDNPTYQYPRFVITKLYPQLLKQNFNDIFDYYIKISGNYFKDQQHNFLKNWIYFFNEAGSTTERTFEILNKTDFDVYKFSCKILDVKEFPENSKLNLQFDTYSNYGPQDYFIHEISIVKRSCNFELLHNNVYLDKWLDSSGNNRHVIFMEPNVELIKNDPTPKNLIKNSILTTIPDFIGQKLLNTMDNKIYIAVGNQNNSDWILYIKDSVVENGNWNNTGTFVYNKKWDNNKYLDEIATEINNSLDNVSNSYNNILNTYFEDGINR